MSLPVQLDEYAKAHPADSPSVFLEGHPEPALHVGGLPSFQRLPSATSEFTTRLDEPGAVSGVPTLHEGGLLRLMKDGGGSGGAMITLGRTNNNDLVLPDERVSKFHGYFQPNGAGWTFTDAGSTNGTSIDGSPILPMRPYPLDAGSTILLSSEVTLVFLFPGQVVRLLRDRTR